MTRKQKKRLVYVMNTFQQVLAVFENNGFILDTNEESSKTVYSRDERDLEFCCCVSTLVEGIQTEITMTCDATLHPRTGTTEVNPIGMRVVIRMESGGAILEFQTADKKLWSIHVDAESGIPQSNQLSHAVHAFRDLIYAEPPRPVKNRKFLNRLDQYLHAASPR